MRWLRNLRRNLFGDDRFERLANYAQLSMGRAVRFDDEYLERVAEGWIAVKAKIKKATGACPPAGDHVVLSTKLEGEEKLYVLVHELGHALDFVDPVRLARWEEIWTHPALTPEDREFVLDIEEQAYMLGKELIDTIGIDVDENEWLKYVGRKMALNIELYADLPDVVV